MILMSVGELSEMVSLVGALSLENDYVDEIEQPTLSGTFSDFAVPIKSSPFVSSLDSLSRNDNSSIDQNSPDFLFGTQGDDVITGEVVDEIIFADFPLPGAIFNLPETPVFGNDTIDGGGGNDVIYGGMGADLVIFDLEPVKNSFDPSLVYGQIGRDTLIDFDPQTDKVRIDLNELVTNMNPAQSFATIVGNDFTNGENSLLIYDSQSGIVYLNPTPDPGDIIALFELPPGLEELSSDNFEIT